MEIRTPQPLSANGIQTVKLNLNQAAGLRVYFREEGTSDWLQLEQANTHLELVAMAYVAVGTPDRLNVSYGGARVVAASPD